MIRTLALLLFTALPAAADIHLTPLPPLPEPEAHDWPAIGRFFDPTNQGGGFCSGTLVAPNIVLTAAHCTSFNASRSFAKQNLFLAGAYNNSVAAQRRIIQTLRHPSYAPDGTHAPDFDIGLWILDSPITDIDPIPIGRANADQFALLGYHKLLPYHLSGRTDCPRRPGATSWLVLGCRVISGNSGSPVLQIDDTGARIVAVTSSQAGANAIAIPIDAWAREVIATHRVDVE